MGTPPAADDCVCLGRNVARESRAAPPTKIAFQVLRGIDFFSLQQVFNSWGIPTQLQDCLPGAQNQRTFEHCHFFSTKSFPRMGYSNKTEAEQTQSGKKRQEQ